MTASCNSSSSSSSSVEQVKLEEYFDYEELFRLEGVSPAPPLNKVYFVTLEDSKAIDSLEMTADVETLENVCGQWEETCA